MVYNIANKIQNGKGSRKKGRTSIMATAKMTKPTVPTKLDLDGRNALFEALQEEFDLRDGDLISASNVGATVSGEIRRNAVALESSAAELFGNFIDFLVRTNDDNFCSGLHKTFGDAASETACSSGYDSFAAGKIKKIHTVLLSVVTVYPVLTY